MKKIYLLLLATVVLSFGFLKTDAQVAGYIPSQSNGTYTSIPEDQGTLVDSAYYGTTANTVDTKGWTIAIPFTFKFRGIDFTSLFANSNGGLTFGATTSTASSLISSTTAFDGAIAPMSRDLWGAFVSQGSVTAGSPTITGVTDFYGIEIGKPLRNTTGVPTTATVAGFDIGAGTITMSTNATAAGTNVGIGWCNGEVRTHTIGSAPNRIFIVEWKDFSDWSTTANTRSILNFQVHLEETTNKISVVYGNNSQNVTTARTNQVGLRGGSNTDYNNRTSATDWSATTAGASNSASVTRTNAINPASGLTFTWEPNLVAVDWCNLQWPVTPTISLGDSVLVYTQAWEPGVTDAAGAGAGLVAWIGVNSANTNPSSWPSSAWKLAAYNTEAGNNDEDSTSIGRTLGAGTYYYASRWQLSGGEYRYGGYNTGGGGFWDGSANVSGVLTITPTLANDICSGAIALTVNADLACGTTTTGTTVGATQSGELPTPTCSATGINDDVWFSFVATGATHVIDITGATNVTAINVYSGSCGSTLTSLGCLTTTSGALSGLVSGLTAGNTYLIRVYSTSSTVGTTTDFTICVGTPPPPPANDECSGAIAIACDGSASGDNTFAGNDALPGITCGSTTATTGTNRAVWYTVTPANSGALTIGVCSGTQWDTYLRVYTGSCGAFTQCAGSDDDGCSETDYGLSQLTFAATAGTTYYIMLGGFGTAEFGAYTISVTCPALCAVPTGVSAGTVTSSGASVTWAGTGTFVLEYGPTGFTPGTGATAGAGGTVINPATSVQAITGLTQSTAYDVYVRQDCTGAGNGFSANSPVVSFTTLAPPPANDVCSGAISLPVNTSCINQTFSTLGATDNDETGDCTNGTEKAVWFSFVATETNATITVDGATGFDAVLGVLSACGSTTTPTGGACIDATGEGGVEVRNLTGLTVGSTYFIQVYEYYGDATAASTFDICVVSVPCSVPTAVTAGSITSTSASVTWVGTGTFVLEYGPAGFTPGTGATAGAGGTVINPATSPQAITGLATSTDYDVYVRQDCSGTGAGFSANSAVESFTTLAPPPANDECVGATTIGLVAISSNNNSATQSLAPISCEGFTSPSAPDVWFQFTPTSNGDATVTLTNAVSLDAIVEVFSGACGSLTSLGCADGSIGSDETVNLTGLTAGQPYYVRVYGWNGDMGTFDIAVSGAAMPVAIEYFRGTKQNSRNVLDWKVSCTGSPSVTLVLERSADGRRFEPIYTSSETAARCLQPFTQNDMQPLAGLNYYRLKTIDIDGKIGYSTIVVLMGKNKGFEIVSLAPNPVKQAAILTVTSAEKSIMEIVVRDINGKQISKQRISLIAGSNQVPLSMEKVAAGVYTVSGLTADGEVRTLKFVKQ